MTRSDLDSADILEAYDYLSPLSPDRWAWEFLRRNEEFRRDAACVNAEDISEKTAPCVDVRLLRPRTDQTLSERWGLIFMPDPERDAYHADAVWNRLAFPHQVEVNCRPRALDQRCELWDRSIPICDITHITDMMGREYLLVRRNGVVVQLCCTGISLLGLEPVKMQLTISDVDGYDHRVKLQKAAFEIYGDGPHPPGPVWTKTTKVLRNCLIALDGLEQGMSHREIAIVLYGSTRVEEDWGGPSMKHAIHYLVKKGQGLRDGGLRKELLGSDLAPAGPHCA